MKLEYFKKTFYKCSQILLYTAERTVPVSFGQHILISQNKTEDAQIYTLMDA